MTSSYVCSGRSREHIAGCGRETSIGLRCQFDIDLACDRASDVVLNREYALDFPLIGVGPEMAVGPSINELAR